MGKKDVRQDILKVATKHFMQDGYYNTSTRKIADELNIKQPVIYYYFKNKVNLYCEVLTVYSLKIGQKLDHLSKQNKDVKTKLFDMSWYLVNDSHLDFAQMMKDIFQVFGKEGNNELFTLWQKNYVTPFNTLFEQLDELRKDIQIDSIVRHYLRILSAYLNNVHIKEEKKQIIEMVDIFVRGISK